MIYLRSDQVAYNQLLQVSAMSALGDEGLSPKCEACKLANLAVDSALTISSCSLQSWQELCN